MPERMKSISEARQTLPSLSQSAQKRMDRFIITHQGQPQSVLLGYEEYQGMKTASELLHKPEIVGSIKTGLEQLGRGERLSPAAVQRQLRDRTLSAETNKLATELAGKSGVDPQTIATVMGTLVDKLLADFAAEGKCTVPGVGTIRKGEEAAVKKSHGGKKSKVLL